MRMKTNGTNRPNQLADEGETTMNGVNTVSSVKVKNKSWIASVIKESTNSLQSSIDEAAETHRMLIHMKGISALTKNTIEKKQPSPDATEIVDFCLICEKQVSRITHLLSLRQQKVQQEEKRFYKVLEYAELWKKNRRGHATLYEQRLATTISAEFNAGGRNAMDEAREAEIEVAIEGLKALADDFRRAGMALDFS
ncbi:hypothetical protein EPUS_06868 [Endocarpon pusillum Z07020]|uniref:Uncharacterized protein n=1 Tax=Endocarpon pusillum (strain Z07020 / HMAS-L-300199) TaxID=1263415 RepID=U1I171_ENDPU|nr:uncharacterized protein EPUS_06868 [Endocarpon pusillum Z07020]ERF77000.1 hypothetical protein EPUS_06868 [Endocarpon pusillum Z07020]